MANQSYPIKIHLFFEKGDPSGICEAWMDNWSGNAHKIPRTFIEDRITQKEINKPGIYFLFGKVGNDTQVYVGESDQVGERIKSHNKDPKKGWFSEVVAITSDKDFLNKANVKYLESVFHSEAIKAKRYLVENSNHPTEATISKSDKAVLFEFIEKTKLLITALGYKVFEEISRNDFDKLEETTFYYRKGDPEQAMGFVHSEGFVVKKGSFIRKEQAEKVYSWIKVARESNMHKVKENILTEDVLFSSPSLAIDFVTGYNKNGLTFWKTSEGLTLGEYLGIKDANKIIDE